jgi:hypothetical protein
LQANEFLPIQLVCRASGQLWAEFHALRCARHRTGVAAMSGRLCERAFREYYEV